MRLTDVALIGVLGASSAAMRGEPSARSAAFTAEQAKAGQDAYESFCISCHQADLGGQNEALPLKGPAFYGSWASRTTGDLFHFISTSMPPGQAFLAEEQYVGLVAYLLSQNGAIAGAQTLSAKSATPVSTLIPKPADMQR